MTKKLQMKMNFQLTLNLPAWRRLVVLVFSPEANWERSKVYSGTSVGHGFSKKRRFVDDIGDNDIETASVTE